MIDDWNSFFYTLLDIEKGSNPGWKLEEKNFLENFLCFNLTNPTNTNFQTTNKSNKISLLPRKPDIERMFKQKFFLFQSDG